MQPCVENEKYNKQHEYTSNRILELVWLGYDRPTDWAFWYMQYHSSSLSDLNCRHHFQPFIIIFQNENNFKVYIKKYVVWLEMNILEGLPRWMSRCAHYHGCIDVRAADCAAIVGNGHGHGQNTPKQNREKKMVRQSQPQHTSIGQAGSK
jgi:hypothetical protein